MGLTLPIGVQFADHHVRRVAYDRASDPSDIAAQEGDAGLLQRVVGILWLPERGVDVIHRRLERRKLDHRVRNLPAPQRLQAFIQPRRALFRRDFPPAIAQRVGEGRQGGLHAHFDRLEGAEGDVGEELGGGGRAEVDDCFVGAGEESVAVEVFEGFVESVFARALEGVAHEGGGPAEEDPAQAFGAVNRPPGREVGGVDFWVDLPAAFDLR